jgi:amino acid transporter
LFKENLSSGGRFEFRKLSSMRDLKKRSLLIPLLSFFLLLSFPYLSFAQEYENELTQGTIIVEEEDLIKIIFEVIRYLLSFLGVAAVLIIIYGGFLWMSAGGNEEKVGKAKKIITQAIIGLIIILLSYSLTMFVIRLIRGRK